MKVVLFDIDGLLLKKQGYLSERFAKQYGIPLAEVTPFFTNELRTCQKGKADLKHELSKYLPQWRWAGSVDDFMMYWFSSDADVDEDVFKAVTALRAAGIKCYLASNQEKYRGEYILHTLDFKSKFVGHFFSFDIGVSKSEPQFFVHVLAELGVPAGDVVFLDNDPKNVESAKSVGIDARLYAGIESLRGLLP